MLVNKQTEPWICLNKSSFEKLHVDPADGDNATPVNYIPKMFCKCSMNCTNPHLAIVPYLLQITWHQIVLTRDCKTSSSSNKHNFLQSLGPLGFAMIIPSLWGGGGGGGLSSKNITLKGDLKYGGWTKSCTTQDDDYPHYL